MKKTKSQRYLIFLLSLMLINVLMGSLFLMIAWHGKNSVPWNIPASVNLLLISLATFPFVVLSILYKNEKILDTIRMTGSARRKNILDALGYIGFKKTFIFSMKYIILFSLVAVAFFGALLSNNKLHSLENSKIFFYIVSYGVVILVNLSIISAIFNFFVDIMKRKTKAYLLTLIIVFLTSFVTYAVTKGVSFALGAEASLFFLPFIFLFLKTYESCGFSIYIPWILYSSTLILMYLSVYHF